MHTLMHVMANFFRDAANTGMLTAVFAYGDAIGVTGDEVARLESSAYKACPAFSEVLTLMQDDAAAD